MLPSKKILSLSIISLKEGQQIGFVRNIVIDPKAKAVAALVVDPKGFFKEQRIIPYNRVVSIGENVITVSTENQAEKATNLPDILELLKEKTAIIGTKVITASGKTLGIIEEFYIDTESGMISSLDISGGKIEGFFKGKASLNADDILTIGSDVVVAVKGCEERLELFTKGINDNVKSLIQIASQKASRKSQDLNRFWKKNKDDETNEDSPNDTDKPIQPISAEIDTSITDNFCEEQDEEPANADKGPKDDLI
ncbi:MULTISPECIES: PRC-barrel domain-containing protein [unclassified Dehalobacter]|uniref:PRC-barrel domain-containing protein n=1 Tax=unclassified Dehalobacter TaxID=2635733 RepID=UPI000E6CFE15|nr:MULTISPECIES: PRC-barrel domain-containing protein [unclassified Dehalobacter]RJE47802.1 photosystem reaction center subunit H [Dehalobacter sp. MCB1]TCX49048.1 photosystem reaction center subunit H [Dehalobacter sp. 14DCB1]TCX56631.1 photosystem reaction center subunit H [Dehalobacter sp. 12DCB1]